MPTHVSVSEKSISSLKEKSVTVLQKKNQLFPGENGFANNFQFRAAIIAQHNLLAQFLIF